MKVFLHILFWSCLLILIGMLYWSSLLMEKNLQKISDQITDLKKELKELKKKVPSPFPKPQTSQKGNSRPYIKEELPNLLSEDPYYTKTLPSLLGAAFSPTGIRREAILGRPQHLHPFNAFKDGYTLLQLCTGSVAKLHCGKYEIYAPFLAQKIEKRPLGKQGFEYWVHLRDDLKWAPLSPSHFPDNLTLAPHFLESHPVTAHDFKFYYDAIINPYVAEGKAAALRRAYSDIESFQVIDDQTFVVRWKIDPKHQQIKYSSFNLTCGLQPLPCFVFQYFADGKKIIENEEEDYHTHSIWAQNFSNHFAKNVIISCGAFLFNGMSEEGIQLVRNPHFYDPHAALVEEYHFIFKESPDTMWQDFKSQKIDLCLLAPHQKCDYENFLQGKNYQNQESKINNLEYVEQTYFYIGWNEKKPFFENGQVRQALNLGIDRQRIIEQNLNNMGVAITSPFFPGSQSSNPALTPLPYDPDAAVFLLEKEGWFDHDGDGIREKIIEGQKVPFQFTLIYYIKNSTTKMICEYVATALHALGIDCRLHGMDLPDLSRQFDDKTFDAVLMGWALGTPPEDPEQLWHSALADEKGSSNIIGFKNKRADELIEKLHYEYDAEKRKAYYHEFHKIIYDEAPYVFLYAPKRTLLYRDNLENLFIPKERQDLIPGADMPTPQFDTIWINTK